MLFCKPYKFSPVFQINDGRIIAMHHSIAAEQNPFLLGNDGHKIVPSASAEYSDPERTALAALKARDARAAEDLFNCMTGFAHFNEIEQIRPDALFILLAFILNQHQHLDEEHPDRHLAKVAVSESDDHARIDFGYPNSMDTMRILNVPSFCKKLSRINCDNILQLWGVTHPLAATENEDDDE